MKAIVSHWKNYLNSWLVPVIFGLLIGMGLLVSSSLSPAWNLLILLAFLTVFAAMISKDRLRFFFFFMLLFIPVGFSKALFKPDIGIYSPAFSIQLVDLFTLAVLTLWLFGIIQKNIKFNRPKSGVLSVIIIVWFGFSLPGSFWPSVGAFETLLLFKCFLIYLFFSNYLDKQNDAATLFLWAVVLSVILQLFSATAQQILKDPLFIQGQKGLAQSFGISGFETFRPRGTLEHPNNLSSFLLFTQPVIFCAAYFSFKGFKRWLLFIIFILSVFIHIWTYSRIGWFAISCEAIIFLFILVKKRMLSAGNLAAIGVCFVLVFSILFIYHDKITDRLFGFDNMSTKSRRVMEKLSLQIISDNLIRGVGYGGYAKATDYYWPDNTYLIGKNAVKLIRGKHYVHNGYLLLMAETGLIGIAVWLAFFIYILFLAYKNIVYSKGGLHMALSTGIFLAISGLMINMSLEHFKNNMLIFIMWICAGFTEALSRWNGRCVDNE